jgi:integrase/recombinase XerD
LLEPHFLQPPNNGHHEVDLARSVLALNRASEAPIPPTFLTLSLDAGASFRDVQDAAGHADPRTTMGHDRARHNLNRHRTYLLAGMVK